MSFQDALAVDLGARADYPVNGAGSEILEERNTPLYRCSKTSGGGIVHHDCWNKHECQQRGGAGQRVRKHNTAYYCQSLYRRELQVRQQASRICQTAATAPVETGAHDG